MYTYMVVCWLQISFVVVVVAAVHNLLLVQLADTCCWHNNCKITYVKILLFLKKKKPNNQDSRSPSPNFRFSNVKYLSCQSYAPHCCPKQALFSRQLG